MYYVYVLLSLKDQRFYTGFTSDLIKRVKRHNSGLVNATKNRLPFRLIYYEACVNKTDALKREIYLKTAWGKRYLNNRNMKFLKGKPQ